MSSLRRVSTRPHLCTDDYHMDFNDSFPCVKWPTGGIRTLMNGIMYPKYIKSTELLQFVEQQSSNIDSEGVYARLFKSWQNRLNPKQLEDGDSYEFRRWVPYLIVSWMSLETKYYKEMCTAARKAVNNLVELAFDLREGATMSWQPDMDLLMPCGEDPVNVDAVVSTRISREWQCEFDMFRFAPPFSWPYSKNIESVVAFVLIGKGSDNDEEEEEEALDRLQMALYAAQFQRRVICCKNGPVFGAIFDGRALRFYVSFWRGKKLVIRNVLQETPLLGFARFVDCYFLLCRIAEYQSKNFQAEFQRWNNNQAKQTEELTRIHNPASFERSDRKENSDNFSNSEEMKAPARAAGRKANSVHRRKTRERRR